MTQVEIPEFDADRATEILDKAIEHKMYPSPLPESAETRIVEAEKVVQLALQARRVAEEAEKAAREAGREPSVNVNLEAVNEVLFVAEVSGGSQKAPAEPPQETAGSAAEVGGEVPAPEPAGDSQAASSTEIPREEIPNEDERWVDDDGVLWVVDEVLANDGGLEAHMDGSEERTVLPPGFLKKKVDVLRPEQSPVEKVVEAGLDLARGIAEVDRATEPPIKGDVEPARDPEYQALLDRVQVDYERSKLPLPGDVPSPPEMPADLTSIPDVQARRLHSQFNSCAARAHYLLGLERQRKIGCQRLVKQKLKPAMQGAREELGTKASVTEVTQTAEEREEVRAWQERAETHSDREAALKDLFDVYTTHVTVLSRDWSMRESGERGS